MKKVFKIPFFTSIKVHRICSYIKISNHNPVNLIELSTHGTQYSGPEVVLVYGWGWYCQIFYTNPNTGLPWTIAELDALIAGVTLGQGGGFGSPACDFLELRALWP